MRRGAQKFKGAVLTCDVSPVLLGVGYIIGPRIAGFLFAGGCLAYLVLIPAIKLFGSGLTSPIFAEAKLISEMSPAEVRAAFVFYIGAGAVASAGIIALIFFVIYQQIENGVIYPVVMARKVKVNPLVVLLSVLIGVELFGFVGALLAVPISGALQVVVKSIAVERQREKLVLPDPSVR